VIKIRYRDADELAPGLHAAAEQYGRETTVFFVPGLTTAERRAALRRLRLSARMGYCPPLPVAQLALALMVDRIRTTVGQVGTLVRSHPAGSTVPVMVISAGAIAFLALSAVSIQVLHRDSGRPAELAVVGGSPTTLPGSRSSQAQPTAGAGGSDPAGPGPAPLSSTSPVATTSPHPLSVPSSADPTPSPSPSASPSPSPSPSRSAAPAPRTQPAPSPSGSAVMQVPPSPQSSPCVNVGVVSACP
jgi:hypothetical protein